MGDNIQQATQELVPEQCMGLKPSTGQILVVIIWPVLTLKHSTRPQPESVIFCFTSAYKCSSGKI